MHHDMGLGALINEFKCLRLQHVDVEIPWIVGLGLHPRTPDLPAGARKFVADIPARKTLAPRHQDAL